MTSGSTRRLSPDALTPGDSHCLPASSELLVLGWGLLCGRVPLLEAGDPAAGVQDLLLARVERVAVGADIGVQHAVRRSAPGDEGVAAGAGHLSLPVGGVDVGLHGWFLLIVVPGRHAGREPAPRGDSASTAGGWPKFLPQR